VQARHARAPKIGDPHIDLSLGYIERRGGLGTGPSIYENALDD